MASSSRRRDRCFEIPPELLNVTVRNVEPDQDTFLRYAREEVFGLVLLFHQYRDAAAEAAMQALTRELIDTALSCGGVYYLPYRRMRPSAIPTGLPQAPSFSPSSNTTIPTGYLRTSFSSTTAREWRRR